MNLYDTIFRWNIWGSWQLEPGHQRSITATIFAQADLKETIALIGPRRAGKSTILYQIMQLLQEKNQVPSKAILHVNFEEPELTPHLHLSLLDEIYKTYRAQVYPQGKAYLFLDEIQNIPEWERWVRARNENENIKIFITGSSAKLMSRELASLLTGRNLTFNIFPLSFAEVLAFKKMTLPQTLPMIPPAPVKHELINYLNWGGYPRVVLVDNDQTREMLLKRYLEEILFRDVVLRHSIRDIHALQNIAIYLLTNTAALISYKRLASIFEISPDLAKDYVHYLKEAFLIEFFQIYSLKAGERLRNPLKVHAIDLGLRKIVSFSENADKGKLLETIVYNELLRHYDANTIFYWKDEGEIDFLIKQGTQVTHLIQVVYEGLIDEKILKRETTSLQAAGKKYKNAKRLIITWEIPQDFDANKYPPINFIPLWHFLLNC